MRKKLCMCICICADDVTVITRNKVTDFFFECSSSSIVAVYPSSLKVINFRVIHPVTRYAAKIKIQVSVRLHIIFSTVLIEFRIQEAIRN